MRDYHSLLVALLLLTAVALVGCQSKSSTSIVGHWWSFDGLFRIEFTTDGEVIYGIEDRPEYLPHIERGRYQLLSEDRLFIDIAHERSGEYEFKVQDDVLQLTDASGRKMVYRRVKVRTE